VNREWREPRKQDEQRYSNTMDIQINQKPLSLPDGATVADALAAFGARPPFAVALNGDFVARTQHAARALQAGDRLDVVHPVAGG
jgi:sulfur carrier protein